MDFYAIVEVCLKEMTSCVHPFITRLYTGIGWIRKGGDRDLKLDGVGRR